jgi:glycosyltransferase involved in cell wall biosynthesis
VFAGPDRHALTERLCRLLASEVVRTVRLAAKRAVRRRVRAALVRYVRAAPRPQDAAGADRRIYFLLNTAYGMGGTIRATLNLAGYLAQRHDVHIISLRQTRNEPFFSFPPRVEVVALDHRRAGATPPRGARLLRYVLSRQGSLFMHPADRAAKDFSLWLDLMLVRYLRRRTGFLITTRPGLNLLAADLSPPGLITIGQEQMNLRSHPAPLRKSMVRRFRKLDALVVLTEKDMRRYEKRLGGRLRLTRIPNTVRQDIGPCTADLDATVIITAGRFTRQKGYDLLIPAYVPVAARHPEWRLRIFGRGKLRTELEALIAEHGLADSVSLEPPARDLAVEMERASIYVLSSRFEGLPLVLLEAMSKGMAVVSFDCPTGPGEVVDDHRNGILVPAKDVEALSAGMLELVDDEELRRRCAAAAVETARGFTMDQVGPMWEALLRDLWEDRAASCG